jgi:hypothetical protein
MARAIGRSIEVVAGSSHSDMLAFLKEIYPDLCMALDLRLAGHAAVPKCVVGSKVNFGQAHEGIRQAYCGI